MCIYYIYRDKYQISVQNMDDIVFYFLTTRTKKDNKYRRLDHKAQSFKYYRFWLIRQPRHNNILFFLEINGSPL